MQNPGIQSDDTSFYQDTVRETKQLAFFASADFDLIPKVLTVTAGTRYFRFNNYSAGSVLSSFGCFEGGVQPTGCHNPLYSYNLNTAQNGTEWNDTESGFKSRGNITWHITPDAMVYYTFSQGFRPGGFNQNGSSAHAFTPGTLVPQYFIPASYSSDKLQNNEIGWKTEFFDHRLQWNGAIYRENWNDVQVAFFDPGVVGNIFFNTNGQDFLVKGLETSLVARVTSGLTVQGAGAWNNSRQTNSPILLNNNPASPGLRQAHHGSLQLLRPQLRGGHQPIRADKLPERECAAAAVQPARPLRVERRRLPTLRAGRRHPPGSFLYPGGCEPDHWTGRHQHRTAAV